jgi:hypothetical protein
MSDKPDIEAIKARLARCKKGAWGFYNAEDYRGKGTEDWAADPISDIAALLAEVERLQRERSEWCDRADRRLTDYMTQQRDLLAENAALRARLTLTPERVEAAIEGAGNWQATLRKDEQPYVWWDNDATMRAALLAAGMEEAEQ